MTIGSARKTFLQIKLDSFPHSAKLSTVNVKPHQHQTTVFPAPARLFATPVAAGLTALVAGHLETNTMKNQINFDAHFQIDGWKGIAFYLIGYAQRNEPLLCYGLDDDGKEVEMESGDFKTVDDTDHVIAVMVGDDRKHVISIEDIHEIKEDGFCRECGQIGCTHNAYA